MSCGWEEAFSSSGNNSLPLVHGQDGRLHALSPHPSSHPLLLTTMHLPRGAGPGPRAPVTSGNHKDAQASAPFPGEATADSPAGARLRLHWSSSFVILGEGRHVFPTSEFWNRTHAANPYLLIDVHRGTDLSCCLFIRGEFRYLFIRVRFAKPAGFPGRPRKWKVPAAQPPGSRRGWERPHVRTHKALWKIPTTWSKPNPKLVNSDVRFQREGQGGPR